MKDRCAFVSSFLPCLQAVCYGSLNGWSRSIGCCNEWPCLGAVLVPLTVPSCSIIRSPLQNLPESSQHVHRTAGFVMYIIYIFVCFCIVVRAGHCLEVLRIVVSISATSSAWVLSTFEASQLQFQLRHLVHLPLDHYKVGKTG